MSALATGCGGRSCLDDMAGCGEPSGPTFKGDSGGAASGTGGAAQATGGHPSVGGAGNGGSFAGGTGGLGARQFFVGGKVGGLVGSGLVLQNNLASDLAVDENGEFFFTSTLADGDTYSVSVLRQPTRPWQTCVVLDGSGRIDGANVRSVGVVCSLDPHVVRVRVSGLEGSTLVLRNGSDQLRISEDGTYAFARRVRSGQVFDVSVLTQPLDGMQRCEVVGGRGQVENGSVEIEVTCGPADSDGDSVPDVVDPFPNDPDKPARTAPGVYANTPDMLFKMDPATYEVLAVGRFSGTDGSIADIAIDRFGLLYAVSFSKLYVCDGTSVACVSLAALPEVFNGLTVVPAGTLDPHSERLVGVSLSGGWYRIELTGAGTADVTLVGGYGATYSSAGDAYSASDIGTYAAVRNGSSLATTIVSIEPSTGRVIEEVAEVSGYPNIFGLAGWRDEIFAFHDGGEIIRIDRTTGEPTLLAQTSFSWWGAGVSTEQ